MLIEDVPELVLNRALEQQITNAIDSRFLLQLVCTYSLSYESTLSAMPPLFLFTCYASPGSSDSLILI